MHSQAVVYMITFASSLRSFGLSIVCALVVYQPCSSDEPAVSKHWAYQTPVRATLPGVRDVKWVRNQIDHFVLARLEKEGLQPSPDASPVALLRRLTFDLTGLPPTLDEVDAFLKESAANPQTAYENAVNRLLESPHYGERWARAWLDAARYADSHGFQRDDLRDVWPYRDWVIKALNRDLPFDQFTVEQLAGDLLPTATVDQRVATGFQRCSPCNVEAGTDPVENRFNQIFDRVNTTATVWLGTTLECAQCHDHKYDPLTMRDYYRLFAYFNNSPFETESVDAAKKNPTVRFIGPYLDLSKSKEKVDAESFESDDTQTGKKRAPQHAMRSLVMQDMDKPRDTYILKRGNFLDPTERVEPGIPAILPPLPKDVPANRLGLARWLVSRDNPLTARVNVNRWWSEVFGRGLVGTPEDFGFKGERPTHRELLDWLAVEFMDPQIKLPGETELKPWSIKHIHRLIVLSATYRQSSRQTPQLRERDDENKLLTRGPRFRLDAEGIRDNALLAAGLLSRKQFGPPIRPPQPDGLWTKVGGEQYLYTVSSGEDKYRRGIYVIVRRSAPYPSFVAFDGTARLACSVKRLRSNTPLQALTLLNDPVYVEAAKALAARVLRDASGNEARLTLAFRLCVTRAPTEKEKTILQRLLDDQRKARAKQPKAEDLAWFDVASALLNLDETITKE